MEEQPSSAEKPVEAPKKKKRRDRLLLNGLRPPRVRGDPKKRKRRKKIGRPKKPGPKVPRKQADRVSPSWRAGARFHSVSVPEEAYAKLKEIAAFYKKPIGRMVEALVEPAFKKAYEESLTLARIAANKEKARELQETLNNGQPPRRTHF